MTVIHWPVAFKDTGKGLQPPSEANPDEVELDLETPIIDTWKAMIKLPKSKVGRNYMCIQFCTLTIKF